MANGSNLTLRSVRERIAFAAEAALRNIGDVTLIAVSKTRSVEEIAPLIAAGHVDFGENRVAEAMEKWTSLKIDAPHIRLHLIGQLQSNKAAQAVANFDMIHAVDRLSLVSALAIAQQSLGKRPGVFLQVNIGDEQQKGGCAVADLPDLLMASRAADLDIRGLMAIPPADSEPAPYFALLAELAHDLALPGLSMGMSNDFETAIRLGATHVRVGSALFGPRA